MRAHGVANLFEHPIQTSHGVNFLDFFRKVKCIVLNGFCMKIRADWAIQITKMTAWSLYFQCVCVFLGAKPKKSTCQASRYFTPLILNRQKSSVQCPQQHPLFRSLDWSTWHNEKSISGQIVRFCISRYADFEYVVAFIEQYFHTVKDAGENVE